MSLSDAPMCDLFRRFARRDWIDMLPQAYAPVVGDYVCPVETVTTYGTPVISANTLYATLILLQRRMRFDSIMTYKNTLGAAGAAARLGIYNVGSDYYPTSLILDAGALDCTVWVPHELTINQTLGRGWYALALVVNDATIVFRARTGALGPKTPLYLMYSAWAVAQAYGALPATYPAGGTVYANRTPLLRVAELL